MEPGDRPLNTDGAGPRPLLLLAPALFLIGLLLFVPLGLIVLSSFDQDTKPGTWRFAFTLAHYANLFQDTFYLEVLARTAALSACVTLITLVFGYVLAVKLWVSGRTARVYLMLIIIAPLLVSIVARTYGWLLILGEKGFINAGLLQLGIVSRALPLLYNDGAIVLGLAHLLIPFAVLSINASLERIEPEIIEAATVAGAGYGRIFSSILFPLTVPGVIVGATLVFSLSMSAYVTPALMGGKSSALATIIFQKYSVAFDWSFGAALAVLLLAASVIGVLAITVAFGAPYRRRLAAAWGGR